MKKIIIIAILMVAVIFAQGQSPVSGQRRYASFNIGGMNQTELLKQIDQQTNNLQKDLKNLDKERRELNLRSQRGDIVATERIQENSNRRTFTISQIEKLTEQKNELLISNTSVVNVKVNAKDPVAMATSYYIIKQADEYLGVGQGKHKEFTGILVNEWNHNVQVIVTGPNNFKREFNLPAGRATNPTVQEFNFQIPGNYKVTFRASNTQAKSVVKSGGMLNTFYYHNGKEYAFKATQFGR